MRAFPETIFDLTYEDQTSEFEQPENRPAIPADQALIDCVNRFGRAEPAFLSALTGKTPQELLFGDLKGAVFQDPAAFQDGEPWAADKAWLLRAQWISGNVLKKLTLAEEMNKRFPGLFQAHINALRKVLPDMPSADEIHVSLGATWLPESLYEEFVQQLLKLSQRPAVRYVKRLHKWTVQTNGAAKGSVLSNHVYGTPDLSAVKIIEQTMNAKNAKVYDYIHHYNGKVESVLNHDKTAAAQEKQKKILRKFDEWTHALPSRMERIQDCYCSTYAGRIGSRYDGSFLQLPGLNPKIRLYKRQRNPLARVVLSRQNVLIAQRVGAGKTYIILCAAHELKRMGLSDKNLIVVPNNILQATVDAHRLLYPDDDILVISPKDFVPEKRDAALREIQTGDHVCIFMAYSSFNMIVMSKSYWLRKRQQEIQDLRHAAGRCTDKAEKRMLEAEAAKRQKQLSKYAVEAKECPWMTFDELGIQTLFVDEAQNYKNIDLQTKADNIVGMHSKGSKKCVEMLEKCHFVERVVFATGTPLTNSMADLFAMQTYLQPEELRHLNIDSFDMWINTFGERETNYEIDLAAQSLRPVTRFSSFHNLPELMSLFSNVCDFSDMDEDESERPAFQGYTTISVPMSSAQKAYYRHLSERADLVYAHRVKPEDDNLLKITTEFDACTLDIRLVNTKAAGIHYSPLDLMGGKINACANETKRVYAEYPGTCQIIFCDIGTPKAGFNVYDELKKELVLRGIPAEEIAFVHDATSDKARSAMFQDMNLAKLRVVIGSTAKLGVGVNVQERLIALHHLSIPWRPSDMVQRGGRIDRPGNTCEERFQFVYLTESSSDGYKFQRLESKQRFISSFLSGTAAARDHEDISDAVFTYAEIKALAIGSPLIRKRVETANRLERKRLAFRQRQKQLTELQTIAAMHPEKREKLRRLRSTIAQDIELYQAAKATIPTAERLAFGEELMDALRCNEQQTSERLFDFYQGFDVLLPADMLRERPYVCIRSENGGRYDLDMDGDKPLGFSKRIDYLLEHLPDRAAGTERMMQEEETQYQAAEAELRLGNPFEEEIAQLTQALDAIDEELKQELEESA